MRKIFLLVLVLAVALGMASYALAVEPSTTTAIVSATVNGDFEVKFYPRTGIDKTDSKIIFPSGAIEFPAITGTETIVYPQGRSASDGFSDIGVLCLSNLANNVTTNRWGLKMKMTGNIPSDNLIVYIPEFAYDRNLTSGNTLGGIQRSKGWYKVETTDILIYKADDNHLLTTQWGTLMTFSFAIIPSGKFMDGARQVCDGQALAAGSYSASIIFTMTTGV